MNKRILSLMAVGLIAMSSAVPSLADVSYSEYTLNSKVLEANRELLYIESDLEEALDDYKTDRAISFSLSDETFDEDENIKNVVDTDEHRFTLATQKNLDYLKSYNAFWDKRIEFEQKKDDLEKQVAQAYFGYMNQVKAIGNRDAELEFMKERFETKKKELELGLITESDLKEFEKAYMATAVNLFTAENSLKDYQRKINLLIGEDVNSEINISYMGVPLKEYTLEDIEAINAEMQENSYQLVLISQELEYSKVEKDLKNRFSGYGSYKLELEQLNDTIDKLTYQIEDKKNDLKYQLYSKYNSLLEKSDDMEIKALELKIAENNYTVAKLKYENGLVSDFDYIEAQQKFTDDWLEHRTAQVDYYVAVNEFESFIELNTLDLGEAKIDDQLDY